MHSLLNIITFQVVSSKFTSERYTKKLNKSKGRSGLIIEIKYDGKVSDALEKAKDYEKLIKKKSHYIFRL